jgi:hypothetical protein
MKARRAAGGVADLHVVMNAFNTRKWLYKLGAAHHMGKADLAAATAASASASQPSEITAHASSVHGLITCQNAAEIQFRNRSARGCITW